MYYVSPEQVSGATVDARSDLYSLGVVGFLPLTGRFPFESDVASAVLVAHVTKSAPPVGLVQDDVPSTLAAIVDRCLQKDPAARFGSALDLVAELELVIAGLDNPAPIAPIKNSRVSNTEAGLAVSRSTTFVMRRRRPVSTARMSSTRWLRSASRRMV